MNMLMSINTTLIFSMDDFKVACIFTKVEFIRYVLNICIVWLRYDLSYISS